MFSRSAVQPGVIVRVALLADLRKSDKRDPARSCWQQVNCSLFGASRQPPRAEETTDWAEGLSRYLPCAWNLGAKIAASVLFRAPIRLKIVWM